MWAIKVLSIEGACQIIMAAPGAFGYSIVTFDLRVSVGVNIVRIISDLLTLRFQQESQALAFGP